MQAQFYTCMHERSNAYVDICLDGQVKLKSAVDVVQAEVALVQPAVAERVALQGLTIQLGPDLRTTYPVVMNFNISGQVNVTGPADPQRLQLQGTIKLDSGEVSHPAIRPQRASSCLGAELRCSGLHAGVWDQRPAWRLVVTVCMQS